MLLESLSYSDRAVSLYVRLSIFFYLCKIGLTTCYNYFCIHFSLNSLIFIWFVCNYILDSFRNGLQI
jgi:hypothetical protein